MTGGSHTFCLEHPERILAAETLLADLATRNDSLSLKIVLTETQKCLNVSTDLVFLAGLVAAVNGPREDTTAAPSNTAALLFAHLQAIYLQEQTTDSDARRKFHWSPTLLPKENIQLKISSILDQRVVELEAQSRKAAKSLVTHETKRSATKNKKKKLKKKQIERIECEENDNDERYDSSDNSTSDHRDDEDSVELHGTHDSCTTTAASQVQTSRKTVTPTLSPNKIFENDDDGAHGSDWTTIQKGKRRGERTSSKSETVEDKGLQTTPLVLGAATNEESLTPKSASSHDNGPPNHSSPSARDSMSTGYNIDLSESVKPAGNTSSASSSTLENQPSSAMDQTLLPVSDSVSDKDDRLAVFEARIHELESQLAESQNKLETERTRAEQAIKAEKEASQERLQAVQLRLYIAQTRLKTFEDALQQHIDAVNENTASPPKSSTSKQPSEEGESSPESRRQPLYSRRLYKQN